MHHRLICEILSQKFEIINDGQRRRHSPLIVSLWIGILLATNPNFQEKRENAFLNGQTWPIFIYTKTNISQIFDEMK